jgi:putative SOS response-associated peptidase YedK
MCNFYSITTNQAAIAALFRVVNRYIGNLAPMPGVFPDYKAPIVRPGVGGRELVTARWGMPSPQHAVMEATKKRAAKLEAKVRQSTSENCCGWSLTAAQPTSATSRASTGRGG